MVTQNERKKLGYKIYHILKGGYDLFTEIKVSKLIAYKFSGNFFNLHNIDDLRKCMQRTSSNF